MHQGGQRQVGPQSDSAAPGPAADPEQRRAEQQTDAWKERYDARAGVEGTTSQAVRRTRLRRTPYRGQGKTHLANVLSATALNIIRADAWLNGTPLGTTRASHLARLTLTA
nr:transposase [Streptomyces sp. WAC 01325]